MGTRMLGVICIAAAAVTAARANAQNLSNEDVLRLVSAGVEDEAIIAKIQSAPTSFDTSVDEMIALAAQGVGTAVLATMAAPGADGTPDELLGLLASAPAAWGVAAPLLVAIVAWWLNMRGTLSLNREQQKIRRYRGLLEATSAMKGQGSVKDDTFDMLMREWDLAWVFCPDPVIKAGEAFLRAMRRMSESTHALAAAPEDADERQALAALVVREQEVVWAALQDFRWRIRRDVVKRTNIKVLDYG